MYETILVPVDGSRAADGAVASAIALARAADATVHALSVVEPDELVTLEEAQRDEVHHLSDGRSREATARVMELADDAGVDVVRHVREGTPYREIAAYADEADADLIVMGTRGATGGTRLGSTAERVITLSDVPTMTVRPTDGAPTDPDRVSIERLVVPTDGSDAAERAAGVALDLAEFLGAAVAVVYVVDRTIYDLEDAPRSIVGLLREGGRNALEAVESEARERGLSVTTELSTGVPEAEILAYADRVDADLLAMGTRGRGETDDRLLGSTTARVVRRSDRPVLTVNSKR